MSSSSFSNTARRASRPDRPVRVAKRAERASGLTLIEIAPKPRQAEERAASSFRLDLLVGATTAALLFWSAFDIFSAH